MPSLLWHMTATALLANCTAITAHASSQHPLQAQVHTSPSSSTLSTTYPANLTYTEFHVWFGPDTNTSQTRIGLTTYPLQRPALLNSSIDGGAIYLSRHDHVAANKTIARFVTSPDYDDPSLDRSFAVQAPFSGVWVAPNLDLDLDGMVQDPYGGVGFLGVMAVDGGVPGPGEKGREGVRFWSAEEYAEFVEGFA